LPLETHARHDVECVADLALNDHPADEVNAGDQIVYIPANLAFLTDLDGVIGAELQANQHDGCIHRP